MIRITGGTLRGRKLKTLDGSCSRPTLSRVREAIFNILGQTVRSVTFVDLFSGVGTMGIEALSRGAEAAIFVEHDARCASILSKNLETLGLGRRATVVIADVSDWVRGPSWDADIVFVDPPYGLGLADGTLELLGRSGDKRLDCVLVQHEPKLTLPQEAGILRQVRSGRYGDTVVDVYEPATVGAP
ncbi:MAG: 16S rRNA (guanine(966)-N(2))-methyltransferase RsmD [Candidatus Eisenbacteria sp.]|nr:16S rRNA (guanine(966)-N(2))-methyltransferase RsmD [Candidatus Eisenbacteria bacterium]